MGDRQLFKWLALNKRCRDTVENLSSSISLARMMGNVHSEMIDNQV
jgi:hypothetical protein